jgi:hypothetical protein
MADMQYRYIFLFLSTVKSNPGKHATIGLGVGGFPYPAGK